MECDATNSFTPSIMMTRYAPSNTSKVVMPPLPALPATSATTATSSVETALPERGAEEDDKEADEKESEEIAVPPPPEPPIPPPSQEAPGVETEYFRRDQRAQIYKPIPPEINEIDCFFYDIHGSLIYSNIGQKRST